MGYTIPITVYKIKSLPPKFFLLLVLMGDLRDTRFSSRPPCDLGRFTKGGFDLLLINCNFTVN